MFEIAQYWTLPEDNVSASIDSTLPRAEPATLKRPLMPTDSQLISLAIGTSEVERPNVCYGFARAPWAR